MRNPYSVLGIEKTATEAEIKSAYRKIAKKYHPDHNQGDRFAEQRFKEASQAYNLLSDATRRKQFDQGIIDANGQPKGPFAASRNSNSQNRTASNAYNSKGQGTGQASSARSDSGKGNPFKGFGKEKDMGDIFSDLFGARKKAQKSKKGSDLRYSCSLNFVEAAAGVKKRITIADGKTLEVTVPAGAEDKQVLRLRGQGLKGQGGGSAGDALVELRIESHPLFRQEGTDVYMDLPLSMREAINGTSITVPTVTGKVKVKVPPKSNTGTMLRLKGKGLEGIKSTIRGDQYIRVLVTLPEDSDTELEAFVNSWKDRNNYNPRSKLDLFDD
ncbi:J domain-containing protein [Kiloniella sp. b19]|uniref:J domain-containing protein n=1 Tax=Kiloniella sp. GXU_MW_B19 TaxID=3141326 RepID=UPI0031DFCD05